MSVRLDYFTDPASAACWAAEPQLRRMMLDFGDEVEITYVMGGLARDFEGRSLLGEWLDAADRSGMPVDPRLWSERPLSTTYPACMAVKAAAEQGREAELRLLRALREGLLCFRRRLDTSDALVELARAGGLDAQRFRIDLGSHAILEAVCDLPGPRAHAELWRLASDWRVKPARVLTGWLWELA